MISTDNDQLRTILYAAPDRKPPCSTREFRLFIAPSSMSIRMEITTTSAARYSPGFIFWLERPDDPLKGPWRVYHVIDDDSIGGVNGIHGLITGDVDRDGKLDLIADSGLPKGAFPNSLAWLRIPPNPRSAKLWERRPVFARATRRASATTTGSETSMATAVRISPALPRSRRMATGTPGGSSPRMHTAAWKKHVVATNQEGATNVQVANVNGDGKADLICSSRPRRRAGLV